MDVVRTEPGERHRSPSALLARLELEVEGLTGLVLHPLQLKVTLLLRLATRRLTAVREHRDEAVRTPLLLLLAAVRWSLRPAVWSQWAARRSTRRWWSAGTILPASGSSGALRWSSACVRHSSDGDHLPTRTADGQYRSVGPRSSGSSRSSSSSGSARDGCDLLLPTDAVGHASHWDVGRVPLLDLDSRRRSRGVRRHTGSAIPPHRQGQHVTEQTGRRVHHRADRAQSGGAQSTQAQQAAGQVTESLCWRLRGAGAAWCRGGGGSASGADVRASRQCRCAGRQKGGSSSRRGLISSRTGNLLGL